MHLSESYPYLLTYFIETYFFEYTVTVYVK